METQNPLDIWLTTLFDKFPFRNANKAIAFGCFAFALGLLIASFSGLAHAYIFSQVFWLGGIGIAWVSGCVVWGCKEYPRLLATIAEAVAVDKETEQEVKKRLQVLKRTRSHLVPTIVLSVLAIIGFYFILARFCAFPTAQRVLGFPRAVFPEEFYTGGSLSVKLALVSFYISICVMLVITAINLFVSNLHIMYILSRNDFRVPFMQAIHLLQAVGTFHVNVAVSWFFGVALVIIALQQEFTIFVSLFVLLLSGLGFAIFFVPQYFFHVRLMQAKEELETELDSRLFGERNTFPIFDDTSVHSLFKTYLVLRLKGEIDGLSTWPFNFSVLGQLLLSFSIPFVTVLLKVVA